MALERAPDGLSTNKLKEAVTGKKEYSR